MFNSSEKRKQRAKRYYESHKDKCIENAKLWKLNNPEKVRESNLKWQRENTEYKKEWQKNNAEKARSYVSKYKSNKKNKLKKLASQKLYYHVHNNKISKKNNCEHCGSTTALQGHHSDYSKPLDVLWLCPKCHKLEHRKMNA